MPRQPRKKSKTGLYHVMVKGIDERDIFLEEEDRKKFMTCLVTVRERGSFALLAYCLMDNHVHLLMEEREELGTAMKRLTVGYVLWHNNKYGRTGHLLQNRYLSEPVETDSYLLTVVRYIHQNPVKAGLVKEAKNYHWSSYCHYIEAYNGRESHIDAERVMGYFPTERDFEAFMNEVQDDKCLGYKSSSKISDTRLTEIIRQKYPIEEIQKLTTEERNKLIEWLYQTETTSIRQLARVLGVSKSFVERAL